MQSTHWHRCCGAGSLLVVAAVAGGASAVGVVGDGFSVEAGGVGACLGSSVVVAAGEASGEGRDAVIVKLRKGR